METLENYSRAQLGWYIEAFHQGRDLLSISEKNLQQVESNIPQISSLDPCNKASLLDSCCKISEITDIKKIYPFVRENTCILFDLDGVIMDPVICLCSDLWVSYLEQEFSSVFPESSQQILTSLIWFLIQQVPIEPIKKDISQFIDELQNIEKVVVLGLTARSQNDGYLLDGESEAELTLRQLRSLDINFSKKALPKELKEFPSFFQGIIFSSDMSKGEKLQQVLDYSEYQPEQVLFVDNNWNHIHSVASHLETMGISSRCFRYRYEEEEQYIFDPLIGNIQLHYLLDHKEILSDLEAKKLKSLHPEWTAEALFVGMVAKYIALFRKKNF